MTYRAFSTDTWQDPWFEQLEPKSKLLHIYLWTNDVCRQSGCYQISPRRVEFETGVRFNETIKTLFPKIEWFPESNTVWVKAFFRRQCANAKFALGAIRSLATIPQPIVERFIQHNADLLIGYGIDTLSIPYAKGTDTVSIPTPEGMPGVCVSVTGSVTDTDTETTLAEKSAEVDKGFAAFWKSYPRKEKKRAALLAWKRLAKERPSDEILLAKVEQLKKSDQWQREGGKYIPHPTTWLNSGGWDDEVIITEEPPSWANYERRLKEEQDEQERVQKLLR